MAEVTKIFTFTALIFLVLALIFNIKPNLPKIPGDIAIDKPGIRIYIPFVSAIVLSLLLTFGLHFIQK